MSFFGQNNNQQQQNTGFGGFGSNNNTGSGFGQPASNAGGFGSNTSTLLGSNTNSGSGFGGFGSGGTSTFGNAPANSTPFGQTRPAFGAPAATSGGGLFGSGTATSGSSTGGFGGFGSTNNNNNNNNNTSGGGLFGSTASKPAFGSGNTGGGLFGGGNTGGGFGSNNTQQQQTNAFGISSALSQNNAECQGTGSTPFTAFTEKEGTGNTTNHFQSISFMAPYKNFSFEELRLADYNQGRRFGNASGQAGAFGSTNFGGFGQQNNTDGFGQGANNATGGLFGQSAASSSPFGAAQPAQTGFGSGSGLFGSKPPQQGSLFGTVNATSSGQSSGGLFGTSGSGFGSGNTGTGFGSGGLFGNNNNNQQQQAKPSLFENPTPATGGFGSSNASFGANNNTTNTNGGLFGQANQNSSSFGQQQPAQNTNPFGSFGQNNQNQTNSTPFGGGGFGQQQQEPKPGGLFGNAQSATSTPSSLFSNNQNNNQQQSTGNLFGNTNNNQTSGSSLFNKPAATSGGLFGQPPTNNTNTGGSLFGTFGNNNNNAGQNQQNQGGGLFNNNQQQKSSSLFGTNATNTGSLFNNPTTNNQQPAGGSIFGGLGANTQQQQQSGGLFSNTANNQGSSLFGTPQQQQAPQNVFQGPQALQTSIFDPNAFGSPSIFSGLPPPPQVVGPIATPINTKNKMKKSAILPHYKMTPSAASRLQTPKKRGFGFSYSTYGTPGSASSNASTPGGLNSSLLYGSVGRGLGKSLSTSNLRRNFDSDAESILTPGAFSAGSSRYGGAGNLKRLNIDRSLRTDLFGDKSTPAALPSPEKERPSGIIKKKVSFDASTVGGKCETQSGTLVNGSNGNEVNNSTTPSAEEQGFLRSSRAQRTPKPNGVPAQPEMEQMRGNELAIVHENESPESSSAPPPRAPMPKPQDDQQPGEYWMKPSMDEIRKMSGDQQRRVSGYSVGRGGCGKVEFNAPVDLTLHNLEDIYDKIVLVELRSLTVYPDQSKKPAQGKGLNVPSTLYLENSWPRQKDRKTPLHEKSGPRFNKHVDRLRKVGGTEFVRYEKDNGTWVFKVPHFTTYGFDYEDERNGGDSLQTSVLSEMTNIPDTLTPTSHTPRNGQAPASNLSTQRSLILTNASSHFSSSPDDTFEFRKKKLLPGAFDDASIFEDDHEMQEINNPEMSFLDERSAASPSDSGEDEPSESPMVQSGEVEDQSLAIHDEDQGTEMQVEMEMAGAFPSADLATAMPAYGTPAKGTFEVSDDWAEELQRTISPRKQDREVLRETQAHILEGRVLDPEKIPKEKSSGKLMTNIDLMNSLFGQQQAKRSGQTEKQVTQGKVVKWPNPKKSKTHDNTEVQMSEDFVIQQEFYKPSWGPDATLLYAIPGKFDRSRRRSAQTDAILSVQKGGIMSEGRNIRFAKFAVAPDLTPESLTQQRAQTQVTVTRGVPMAKLQQTPFHDVAASVAPTSEYEKSVWQLASILFDDQDSETFGVPALQKEKYDHRIRKDRLIAFWEQICDSSAKTAASEATSAEERAVAHLSANKVVEACDALVKGKDFRLATLVSQIGGDNIMRDDIAAQIGAWRDLNVLSEMTEPIRALYALLAGNTCICEGKKGPLEDKARTFVISERFNLDWKRAFGLKLFYAILAQEPIEVAIKKFEDDLHSDEGKKPLPWFVESPSTIAWNDPHPDQREDVLWGLLKLYAASKDWLATPLIAHIIMPQNTSINPLNVRLSFQLYHALTIRFPSNSTPTAADTLANDFSTQLDSAGEWLWALFASLHLSSASQRQYAIQSLLAHHAADFVADPSDERFLTLIEDLKIPESWIWEAKALHARSVLMDHVREVGYLVKAGDWEEAHEVLRRTVGPDCVIEENWGALQVLLHSFKPGKGNISEWGLGGQVYEDFLGLIKEFKGKKREEALNRLLGALPLMVNGTGGKKVGFREMVAVREISGVVGRELLAMEERGMDGAKVLQLPVTEDAHIKHTMELSLRYYQGIMAGD